MDFKKILFVGIIEIQTQDLKESISFLKKIDFIKNVVDQTRNTILNKGNHQLRINGLIDMNDDLLDIIKIDLYRKNNCYFNEYMNLLLSEKINEINLLNLKTSIFYTITNNNNKEVYLYSYFNNFKRFNFTLFNLLLNEELKNENNLEFITNGIISLENKDKRICPQKGLFTEINSNDKTINLISYKSNKSIAHMHIYKDNKFIDNEFENFKILKEYIMWQFGYLQYKYPTLVENYYKKYKKDLNKEQKTISYLVNKLS